MDKIYLVSAYNEGRKYPLGYCATLDLAKELAERSSTYGVFQNVLWKSEFENVLTTKIEDEWFDINIIPLINSSEKISEFL